MQAYVATANFAEFLAVQEDIFLRTIDLGRKPAPALLFLRRRFTCRATVASTKPPGNRPRTSVDAWRQAGKLPFLNLAAAESQRLRGTLDWPPRGAPPLVAGAAVPDGDVD